MDDINYRHVIEAYIFAAQQPVKEVVLQKLLPEDGSVELAQLLAELKGMYENRGVQLVQRGNAWAFRTAPETAAFLADFQSKPAKLSSAALETLAIIAYHQPVTRAEIEEIRGVTVSKGTLDTLMEAGWVGPKGRRESAGRPVTWGTTLGFLDQFGLESLRDLPGLTELKEAGLLDKRARPVTLRIAEDDSTGDLFENEDTDEDERDIA